MKRFTTLFLLLFLFKSSKLNAQTYKAHLAFGSNLTEAYLTESGNSQVGSRLGFNIGPGVSAMVSNRWETSMELLYSQNGYYTNFSQPPTLALNKITLHYIEVPLSMSYRFNIKKNEKENFFKRSIGGGITYARLFKHKVIATDGTNLTDEVRFDQINALLFHVAATSFFNRNFAVNGRGTFSTSGEWTLALRLLYCI